MAIRRETLLLSLLLFGQGKSGFYPLSALSITSMVQVLPCTVHHIVQWGLMQLWHCCLSSSILHRTGKNTATKCVFSPSFSCFYGFKSFYQPGPGGQVVFGVPENKLWIAWNPSNMKAIDLLQCNTDVNNTMYLSSKKSGLTEHDVTLILRPAGTEEELLPKGSTKHVKPTL